MNEVERRKGEANEVIKSLAMITRKRAYPSRSNQRNIKTARFCVFFASVGYSGYPEIQPLNSTPSNSLRCLGDFGAGIWKYQGGRALALGTSNFKILPLRS